MLATGGEAVGDEERVDDADAHEDAVRIEDAVGTLRARYPVQVGPCRKYIRRHDHQRKVAQMDCVLDGLAQEQAAHDHDRSVVAAATRRQHLWKGADHDESLGRRVALWESLCPHLVPSGRLGLGLGLAHGLAHGLGGGARHRRGRDATGRHRSCHAHSACSRSDELSLLANTRIRPSGKFGVVAMDTLELYTTSGGVGARRYTLPRQEGGRAQVYRTASRASRARTFAETS